MKRCHSKAIFVGLIATVWLYTGVRAQGQTPEASGKASDEEAQATTRVTLGSTSGTAGDLIVVPIYFTPAQGVEVGRLKLEITYVSVNLKFSKLDAGMAAEMGGVELHSEVKEAKNEKGVDTQTLQMTSSFSSSEPPQKGIPPGLLAYVTMKISETGRSASITLRGSAEANELGSNKPLQKLKVFDTTVDVLASSSDPMVTCFFFSH